MQINVNLETLSVSFADKKKLVDFLLKRAGAAPILLNTLKSIIEECETLTTLSEIFDLLNSNQR
jgi:F0F1-type ATP synthase delta subunit